MKGFRISAVLRARELDRDRVDDLSDLVLSDTPPLSGPWDPVQMAAQARVKAWHLAEPVA